MLGVKSIPCSGGIAKYTEELGSRLVARGHQVTVYCRPHYLDDQTCGTHLGIQRCTSPGLRGKHFDAPSHTLTATCNSILRDFDVLHIHGLAPGFVTPLVRAFSRKRIVLTAATREYVRYAFNWDRTTDSYEQLYTSCVQTKQKEGSVVSAAR